MTFDKYLKEDDELDSLISDIETSDVKVPEGSPAGDELPADTPVVTADELPAPDIVPVTDETPPAGETPPDTTDVVSPGDATAPAPADPMEEIKKRYADFSSIKLAEKIQILMDMIKEMGYANFNFKITQDKNSIEIKGKFDDRDKSELAKMVQDLGMKANFTVNNITKDKFQTIIALDNTVSHDKFKDIWLKTKADELAKQQAAAQGM